MSTDNATPARRRPAPPSSLGARTWASSEPAAAPKKLPTAKKLPPRPRPKPVLDEGMPEIIQDTLNEDQLAQRNRRRLVLVEIAVVATGIFAAALLVYGLWSWLRIGS